jgi:hypothetical protein
MRLALPLLSLLSACHLVKVGDGATSSNGIPYIGAGNNRERVGPYWGPECVKIGAPSEPIRGRQVDANPTEGKQPNLSHDPADQILRLVCVDTIMADADEPERNTWVVQHHRFDELYFDHFTASQMLVQCLLADSCLDGPHVVRPVHDYQNSIANQRMAEQRAAPPDVWQYYEAGMMRWYAANVEPGAVQKRLAQLPLPPQAIAVYMRLLDRARTDVVAFTDNLLPDAKQIFVDLPMEVYTRRQGEYAKSAKYVAELAVLVDQVKDERNAGTTGVSDDTVDKLVKLRIAYEKSCKGDCTGGTIFATMTRQLFWAYVSRGDAPAATAEAKLLDKLDPTAAQEIGDKQQKLIAEAQGRLGRVQRAREQGIDPDAARSTANGSITDFGNGRYVYDWNGEFKVHWESLIPAGKVGPIEGKVAGFDRRGKDVTIRFQDVVSSWEEGTGCHETGRIESIDRDGRITYRERCSGSTTKSSRQKVEPVTMLASEVAGIQPGDEVIGFTSFGPKQERVGGRVWVVRRGQRLVRLRDVPL